MNGGLPFPMEKGGLPMNGGYLFSDGERGFPMNGGLPFPMEKGGLPFPMGKGDCL